MLHRSCQNDAIETSVPLRFLCCVILTPPSKHLPETSCLFSCFRRVIRSKHSHLTMMILLIWLQLECRLALANHSACQYLLVRQHIPASSKYKVGGALSILCVGVHSSEINRSHNFKWSVSREFMESVSKSKKHHTISLAIIASKVSF